MASNPASILLTASLEDARISRLPPTAYYIPNFITSEEEAAILRKVTNGTPTDAPTTFRSMRKLS